MSFKLSAVIAAVLSLVPFAAQSATTLFTTQAAFEAVAGPTEALITTAQQVALAQEVTEPLTRNTGVGSTLTFVRTETHLGRSFILKALEDGGMTFDDDENNGNLPNFDNALSIGDLDNAEDDDWEITISDGPAMRAFAVVLRDNSFQSGESFSLLDADGLVLDTVDVSALTGGSQDFVGLVSDQDFFGVRFDENASGDDMAVADFRFEVPPTTFTAVPQSANSSLRPMLAGLNDGRVLRTGGVNFAPAAVLSPASFGSVMSVPLADSRRSQSMTALLRSGQVILMGGTEVGIGGIRSKTDFFSPGTNAWSQGPDLLNPRFAFPAVRLNDGRILIMGGFDVTAPIAATEIYDPVNRTWQAANPMSKARGSFPAARLADGKILVAGGSIGGNDMTSACEIFDPATGNWSATGAMTRARASHLLTTLLDGRLLAIGGTRSNSTDPSAEIYNPATGQWTVAPGATNFSLNGAIRLPDGRVLAGGGFLNGVPQPMDIYDPLTNTFGPAPALVDLERFDVSNLRFVQLTDGRAMSIAFDATTWVLDNMSAAVLPTADGPEATANTHTLMADGRVLVAGGIDASGDLSAGSQVFDPQTGQWGAVVNFSEARRDHAAVLLNNGSVMAAGGFSNMPTSIVELYDPTGAGAWAFTGPLRQARSAHTANLLSDGNVLVIGGFVSGGASNSVERWSPDTGIWTETPDCLTEPLSRHTGTTLLDGRVLIVGGLVNGASSATVQIFDPSSGTCSVVASLAEDRAQHSATLLQNGHVLVAGGWDAAATIFSTEIYDPQNDEWRLGPPLSTARRNHQASLLPSGMILVTGGLDRLAGALKSAEVFDPVAQRWFGVQALAEARSDHGATVLFNGSVLITGGSLPGTTALAASEIISFGFTVDDANRPVITGINPDINPIPAADDALTITGNGFSTRSESAGALQSGDDYPTVVIRRLDNGARVVLPVNEFKGWSASEFNANPAALIGGPSIVTVIVGGIASKPVYLTVGPPERVFADSFED